ncbi:hypothetical protein Tco_1032216 [Tanacetum coccineum]|uniref:Uncharacterized protein n=1 Tax=Tanacetum coccineum TaxID=301880 RepID=A0ABQ5GCN8_9ASTR
MHDNYMCSVIVYDDQFGEYGCILEEESLPVYDTDIEDVIEEEEGFVGKRGLDGEEDNIKDFVVVLMIFVRQ